MVCKFCRKAQFPHSFGQVARNDAETVPFHKIYTPWNQVKLRHFTQCLLLLLYIDQQIEQELVLYKWYLYKTNPIYISYIHVYEINLAIFVLCMICFIYNIYAWSNLLESSSAPYFSCFSKNSDNRVLQKLCNKERKKIAACIFDKSIYP